MVDVPERWEHGSEFHLIAPSISNPDFESGKWATPNVQYASGRGAFCGLLDHGAEALDLERLLVPGYFCQEVVEAMKTTSLVVEPYRDDPFSDWVTPGSVRNGDALLVVNHFGVRRQPDYAEVPAGVTIIEDHTHDPWSSWASNSDAAYIVVSLRKTLPLPDGALVYSPKGLSLPIEPRPSGGSEAAVADKLAAMTVKGLYLAGVDVTRDQFRDPATRGELALGEAPISAMSSYSKAMSGLLPLKSWRKKRSTNYVRLATRLSEAEAFTVAKPATEDAVPFSCVLVFSDPIERDRVRERLIDARVFPAVLWPLDDATIEISEEDKDLSRRILSLHCDGRYDSTDMDIVAEQVRIAAGTVSRTS